MLNDISLNLFNIINTASIISTGKLRLIFFLAKQLILIFPIITITYWFWGASKRIVCQRIFVYKTTVALIISLILSSFIGIVYPQKRPFMLGIGQYFLNHAPTSSFPSNHATIAFTFAFSFLFWLKKWIGLLLFIPAFIIAWVRIFLGIHWPVDMLGGFLVAIISCKISQIIWKINGENFLLYIVKIYQILFVFFIKKGWIKE